MNDKSLLSGTPEQRKRAIGAILALAMGACSAYVFMYLPVHEGLRQGHFQYSVKGVMLVPLCLYVAVLQLLQLDRTKPMRVVNDKGKRVWTLRGRLVIVGMVASAALSYWGWTSYLHALGFTTTEF